MAIKYYHKQYDFDSNEEHDFRRDEDDTKISLIFYIRLTT